MGWIRISDDFYDNDKFADVGPLGVALYFAAMGFCNRKLSDGYFKKSKARLLLDFDGIGVTTASGEMFAAGVEGDDAAKLVVEWMLAADLWHEAGHDCDSCHSRADGGEPARGEYLIHDYLEFQPSRAEVEAKAEATKARVAAWRESQKSGNSVGNSVTNTVPTEPVTANVQPTPNPNPNPNISSLVTSSGGVTKVDARATTAPPKCSRHKENSDKPCGPCRRRRLWEEAEEERRAADELESRRQQKQHATQLLKTCRACDEDGWRYDDRAIKCDHQEASNA